MDEKILKLKQQLLIDINNSKLPITVLSMMIHELSQNIDERQMQITKRLILKNIKSKK